MNNKKEETCPRCNDRGFGVRLKEIKKWSYQYFVHKVKKSNGNWGIRWCYLRKARPPTLAQSSILETRSADSQMLGNIQAKSVLPKPNTSRSRQISIETSPYSDFGKAFEFAGGESKRFQVGLVGFEPTTASSQGWNPRPN